jgi:hypothetical protein
MVAAPRLFRWHQNSQWRRETRDYPFNDIERLAGRRRRAPHIPAIEAVASPEADRFAAHLSACGEERQADASG